MAETHYDRQEVRALVEAVLIQEQVGGRVTPFE
jgi:hypothetical protein